MKRLKYFIHILFLLCCLSIAAQAQQTTVNAADYSPHLAPGCLASAFGVDLAATSEQATQTPLPTQLAGTRVLVNGKAAPLLYVSPQQINYQLPADTASGAVEVVVERSNGLKMRETIEVKDSGFAAFSFDLTGTGTGAILDGRTFKQGPYEVVTERGEPTILALFGTGLGNASSSSSVSQRVSVSVGGVEAKVHYAGPQSEYIGLDQINFELPPGVADHGTLPVVVKVDEQPANSVTVAVTATDTASVSIAVEESFTDSGEVAGLRVSPFPDIDTLKVAIRTVNLVTDKGVEIAVISAPLTVDLLSSEAAAKLLKRIKVMPGTYLALTTEISAVMAGYKGQAVPMKLANKNVKQTLRHPLKLEKESTIGVSFGFDLRSSVKKQSDGSYVFDPVMLLAAIPPFSPPPPLQKFEGKITGIDANTKMLKVFKGEGSNSSNIEVDANKARILTPDGKASTFSALKVDDKVEVTGQLNSKGVVEALVIIIGGTPPPPPRPVFATGTISAINAASKTFDLNVESLFGVHTFAPVRKMTIKWDDKTKFADDLRGTITAGDLLVGHRVTTHLVSFADPSLASSLLVLNPHVKGTVADITGLPDSFLVNPYRAPGTVGPAVLTKVKLTSTTKIKNAFGVALQPSDLTLGAQIDAVGPMPPGTLEMTATYIIVFGTEIKGSTSTTEVDTAAKTFVLTNENGKAKISVTDKTSISVIGSTSNRPQFVRPDEFIKLLANKAYNVYVFGFKEASGAIQAYTIRAEEKK